ncbi:MAG: phospholipase D-like domain-containing protein [Bacteroidales bacterium]|nr:phospholipase D-like domain-containing protein [Bacteroidales bacterium]
MKKTGLIAGLALAGFIHLSAQQDMAGARERGSGASVTISGIITHGEELGSIRIIEDTTASSSSIRISRLPILTHLSTGGFTVEWGSDVEGSTEALIGFTPALELDPVKESGTTTSHSVEIDGLSPAQLFYMQAFSVHETDTAKAPLQVLITRSESAGSIRTLFNRPVDQSLSLGLLDAEYYPEELDEELIAYIDRAEESIDLALYNLDNSGISDISAALNRAYQRGVTVRAVYDGDVNATGMQSLHADIGKLASPPSDYPHYGIMHNKFVIIDADASDPLKPLVWTGSTNFSYNQVNTDPNNVLVIQDQSLARAYRLEFNEMFGSSGPRPDPSRALFGPDKTDNTPHEFLIGGKRVECYFSPSDGTHQQILNSMGTAEHSLYVATMLITREDLGETLILSSNQGVDTRVLLNDYDQYGEPIMNALKSNLGEDVRLKGEPGIMHHKYMIVDQAFAASDPLLLTGSHNWSSSAELRNDENTLIIHDQGVANAYYQEFMPRFRNGKILVSNEGHKTAGPCHIQMELYPNPASDWIHIKIGEGLSVVSISLMDPGGRVILRQLGNTQNAIDVSHLSHGIYLLQVTFSDGRQEVWKVSIN